MICLDLFGWDKHVETHDWLVHSWLLDVSCDVWVIACQTPTTLPMKWQGYMIYIYIYILLLFQSIQRIQMVDRWYCHDHSIIQHVVQNDSPAKPTPDPTWATLGTNFHEADCFHDSEQKLWKSNVDSVYRLMSVNKVSVYWNLDLFWGSISDQNLRFHSCGRKSSPEIASKRFEKHINQWNEVTKRSTLQNIFQVV